MESAKTREKVVQFPIETSMPWILTEHLLSVRPRPRPAPSLLCCETRSQGKARGVAMQRDFGSPSPRPKLSRSLAESTVPPLRLATTYPPPIRLSCALYTRAMQGYPPLGPELHAPLALYSDAASFSVDVLRSSFLYAEIEAECDLALKQLFFRIADTLFSHAKRVAAKSARAPASLLTLCHVTTCRCLAVSRVLCPLVVSNLSFFFCIRFISRSSHTFLLF